MEYSQSLGIQVTEEVKMKIGTYTGDGTANRFVDIGFTPEVIWIYNGPENTHIGPAFATTNGYASSLPGTGWGERPENFQGIEEGGFRTGDAIDGEGTNVDTVKYIWAGIAAEIVP